MTAADTSTREYVVEYIISLLVPGAHAKVMGSTSPGKPLDILEIRQVETGADRSCRGPEAVTTSCPTPAVQVWPG